MIVSQLASAGVCVCVRICMHLCSCVYLFFTGIRLCVFVHVHMHDGFDGL